MTFLYWFEDVNAAYVSQKTGRKVSPYLKKYGQRGIRNTRYPQVFTQESHVFRHLEYNDYTTIPGAVLVRFNLDTSERSYLVATGEKCGDCGEILNHAVGIEIWCPCSMRPSNLVE